MDEDYDLLIEEDGTIRYVYADDLAEAFEGEETTTIRASHVEPHPARAGWLADMRPSGGPVLGRGWERTPKAMEWSRRHEGNDGVVSLPPFPTRAEALAAERAWLRKEKGL
jgi:hypothetical protein